VSFEIVLRNLQRTPFLLKNDEAVLVNNCLKDILKKSEDSEVVPINLMNVAMKKIIGEYDTYTEHDEISVERTIHKKYFKDREIGLKDEFKKLVLLKEYAEMDLVSIEDIKSVMNQCGCKVSKEHLAYIHLALFREDDSLDWLRYERLFDLFGGDAKKNYAKEYLDQLDDLNRSDRNIGSPNGGGALGL
jgi:hypothetical protein